MQKLNASLLIISDENKFYKNSPLHCLLGIHKKYLWLVDYSYQYHYTKKNIITTRIFTPSENCTCDNIHMTQPMFKCSLHCTYEKIYEMQVKFYCLKSEFQELCRGLNLKDLDKDKDLSGKDQDQDFVPRTRTLIWSLRSPSGQGPGQESTSLVCPPPKKKFGVQDP